MRKVPLIYPRGTYRRQNFYYRGGDPYREQEYINDEAIKAINDFKRAKKDLLQVQRQYSAAADQEAEANEYTIQIAQNLGENSKNTSENARLRQTIFQSEQDLSDIDKELSDLQHKTSHSEMLPIINEHASYKPDLRDLNHAVDTMTNKITNDKRSIANTLISQEYSYSCDTLTEYSVADKFRNYLKSEVNKQFNNQGSRKTKSIAKNTTLATASLKGEGKCIAPLLDSYVDTHLALRESEMHLKLAKMHEEYTTENLLIQLEDMNAIARLDLDIDSIRNTMKMDYVEGEEELSTENFSQKGEEEEDFLSDEFEKSTTSSLQDENSNISYSSISHSKLAPKFKAQNKYPRKTYKKKKKATPKKNDLNNNSPMFETEQLKTAVSSSDLEDDLSDKEVNESKSDIKPKETNKEDKQNNDEEESKLDTTKIMDATIDSDDPDLKEFIKDKIENGKEEEKKQSDDFESTEHEKANEDSFETEPHKEEEKKESDDFETEAKSEIKSDEKPKDSFDDTNFESDAEAAKNKEINSQAKDSFDTTSKANDSFETTDKNKNSFETTEKESEKKETDSFETTEKDSFEHTEDEKKDDEKKENDSFENTESEKKEEKKPESLSLKSSIGGFIDDEKFEANGHKDVDDGEQKKEEENNSFESEEKKQEEENKESDQKAMDSFESEENKPEKLSLKDAIGGFINDEKLEANGHKDVDDEEQKKEEENKEIDSFESEEKKPEEEKKTTDNEPKEEEKDDFDDFESEEKSQKEENDNKERQLNIADALNNAANNNHEEKSEEKDDFDDFESEEKSKQEEKPNLMDNLLQKEEEKTKEEEKSMDDDFESEEKPKLDLVGEVNEALKEENKEDDFESEQKPKQEEEKPKGLLGSISDALQSKPKEENNTDDFESEQKSQQEEKPKETKVEEEKPKGGLLTGLLRNALQSQPKQEEEKPKEEENKSDDFESEQKSQQQEEEKPKEEENKPKGGLLTGLLKNALQSQPKQEENKSDDFESEPKQTEKEEKPAEKSSGLLSDAMQSKPQEAENKPNTSLLGDILGSSQPEAQKEKKDDGFDDDFSIGDNDLDEAKNTSVSQIEKDAKDDFNNISEIKGNTDKISDGEFEDFPNEEKKQITSDFDDFIDN